MSEAFGPFLRSIREKLGKTMRQVADLLGVSVVYISDIERGRRNPPSEDKIRAIAKFFQMPPDDLLEKAAEDRGKVELELTGTSPKISEAALVLARKWPSMTEAKANELIKLLEREDA